MAPIPPLFVSHGAPTLAVEDIPASRFLKGLGALVPRPRAVIVASAHWETGIACVSASARPETIQDFHGFPPALYQLRYPAPGAPDLADIVVDRLRAAGIRAETDSGRGLDHGAWVPLMLAYPNADIPVVQLSVQPDLDGAHHIALGEAIGGLAHEDVLILGSGGVTHNLAAFRGQAPDAPAPDWVKNFRNWVEQTLTSGDTDRLARFETAPNARDNHPSAEHFLPLLVAAGAGGRGRPARLLHASYSFGVLAMDAYGFGGMPTSG